MSALSTPFVPRLKKSTAKLSPSGGRTLNIGLFFFRSTLVLNRFVGTAESKLLPKSWSHNTVGGQLYFERR